MKKMPYDLKQKLRQYDSLQRKSTNIHSEIVNKLEEYGVPYENLTALDDGNEPSTEALAFINNCEGEIEGNIREIEEVFLYFVHKMNTKNTVQ